MSPARRLARAAVRAALIASLAIGALAADGCQRAPDDDAGYIRVAITTSPRDLDPRLGVDEVSQRLHQLIFASLFKLDAELRVVPDLAERWESPDPTTYIVHLRPNVKFHDGSPLTAEDVAHTFRSFLDPKFVSGRKGAYKLLDAVDVVDPLTVRFRLKEPFGSFPINLVMGIVKRGAVNTSRAPIGAGPYRFQRELVDDRVVLQRFDDYFGGSVRNPGLVLKVVPDDTMRGLELRKGTIDLIVNDLSPDIVHELERAGHVRLTTTPGCDYAYVGMNVRDPLLRDVRVRQALAYGVNRKAIVDYLRRGLARPAVGIVPPMSWAFDEQTPAFAHDPARAKKLLDEAGYPDPDGDGPLPRFTITLKSSTTEFTRLQSAVLQEDWKKIGVAVNVRTYELATFLTDVARGNFQMCSVQWVGVTDPDMLRRVFHTGQAPPVGFNRGRFSNPAVDELIDRATRSTDDAERRALYGEVQRRVALEVPYVSLWHKTNVAIAQRDIEGVSLTPTADFGFLRNVSRSPKVAHR